MRCAIQNNRVHATVPPLRFGELALHRFHAIVAGRRVQDEQFAVVGAGQGLAPSRQSLDLAGHGPYHSDDVVSLGGAMTGGMVDLGAGDDALSLSASGATLTVANVETLTGGASADEPGNRGKVVGPSRRPALPAYQSPAP